MEQGRKAIALNEEGANLIIAGRYMEAIQVLSNAIKSSQTVAQEMAHETEIQFIPLRGSNLTLEFDASWFGPLFEGGESSQSDMEHEHTSWCHQPLFSASPMRLTLGRSANREALLCLKSTIMVLPCAVIFNLALAYQLQANHLEQERGAVFLRKSLALYQKSMYMLSRIARDEELYQAVLKYPSQAYRVVHLVNMMACYDALGQAETVERLMGALMTIMYFSASPAAGSSHLQDTSSSPMEMDDDDCEQQEPDQCLPLDMSVFVHRVFTRMILSSETTAPAA